MNNVISITRDFASASASAPDAGQAVIPGVLDVPQPDPQSIITARPCLVWDRADTGRTALATIRHQRRQEHTLAALALALIEAGRPDAEIRVTMASAAGTMTPPPPVEVLHRALSLGYWRARHGG